MQIFCFYNGFKIPWPLARIFRYFFYFWGGGRIGSGVHTSRTGTTNNNFRMIDKFRRHNLRLTEMGKILMVSVFFVSAKAWACRMVWGGMLPQKILKSESLKTPFRVLSGWQPFQKVLKIVIFSFTLTKKDIVIIWRHVKTKNTTVPVLLVMSVLLGKNSFELHPLKRNKLWTYLFSMSIWLYQRYLMS